MVSALDRILRGENVPGLPEALLICAWRRRRSQRHDGAIRGLAINNDGQFLVTAGEDSRARLWQAMTLHEIKSFLGDFGAVDHLALAPGGKWAATCAMRLTTREMGLQLWDLTTGAERRDSVDRPRTFAALPFRQTEWGSPPCERQHDLGLVERSERPQDFLHEGPCRSRNGTLVHHLGVAPFAGPDGTVRQWDLRTGKTKGVIQAAVGPITGLAFGSKRVAVAGITWRCVSRGVRRSRFTGHTGQVLRRI